MANATNTTELPVVPYQENYSPPEVFAWSFAFGVEAFLIICGNIVTISTFVGTKQLRRQSAILLINLATADLCVGALAVPLFTYVFVAYYWCHDVNKTADKIHRVIDGGTGYASVFSLVLVALERLRVIVWPLHQRLNTKRCCFLAVALTWMFAFLMPLLDITRVYTHMPGSVFVAVPLLAVALIVMCVAYAIIYVQVRFKRQKLHQRRSLEFERAFAITLLIVTITSVCTWLPYQVILFTHTLCRGAGCPYIPNNVLNMSKLLHYGNSLVNPIIYSLRFPEFRKAAVRALSVYRGDRGGSGSKGQDGVVLMQMKDVGGKEPANPTANTSIRWTWRSRSARGSSKSNGSPRL